MKIVNIIGGLGNQMFQYALALSLQHRYPDEDIRIDISHFWGYGLHNGFEIDRIFGQAIPTASARELLKMTYYCPWYKASRVLRRLLPARRTELIEKEDYVFDAAVLNATGDRYYDGYWQSSHYFDHCRDIIIDAFQFPTLSDEKNRDLSKRILISNSVSVHVRRGDYLGISNVRGICDLDYYSKAICAIQERLIDPVFFVYSDDIDWCKRYLQPLLGNSPTTFVSHNHGRDSYKDMLLMSMSKACILANSSFSWWGAYLNQRADKIIIAPSRWVNDNNSNDIYLENCIRIQK